MDAEEEGVALLAPSSPAMSPATTPSSSPRLTRRKLARGDPAARPTTPALPPPSLQGEYLNLVILLLLYFLQGVPMGLAAAVPLFLKERLDERDIANFYLCTWPYSLKLLWAPVVDSVYSRSFGRRKSWVIPVQWVAGLAMIVLSYSITELLEAEPPRVLALTLGFLLLYFLVATQDIAVDGWAISMLRRENVGFASTCNTIGQSAGYMASYALFMALTSGEFCNRFRPYLGLDMAEEGVVTMPEFLRFWGALFLVITTLVAVLKREGRRRNPPLPPLSSAVATPASTRSSPSSGSATRRRTTASPSATAAAVFATDDTDDDAVWPKLLAAYKEMALIVRLKAVAWLVVMLLTSRIGFLTEAGITFELMDKDVKKEDIMLYSLPLMGLEMVVAVAVSRTVSGPHALTAYLYATGGRLVGMVAFCALFASYGPEPADGSSSIIPGFLLVTALFRLPCQVMFVSQMAFFAKVADPEYGGTYMTLLNTMANLGYMWTSQLGLRAIAWVNEQLQPSSADAIDGFLLVTVFSAVLGVAWLVAMYHRVLGLQALKMDAWKGASGERWPLPSWLAAAVPASLRR